jgi:hypothetical protein
VVICCIADLAARHIASNKAKCYCWQSSNMKESIHDQTTEPSRKHEIRSERRASTRAAASRAGEGRGGEGLKRITVAVDPDEHKKLKRLAVDAGRSIEDLMREALADLFAKHA